MKIVRSRTGWFSALLAVLLVGGSVGTAAAQTTTMPSTLRYGSGYLDVPSASVIPHLAVLGTFSGFWVDVDETLIVDDQGRVVGVDTNGRDDFFGDGSVTLGLFDRVEVGASFQSFNDTEAGGNIVGAFGQVSILRPEEQGIGLAGGLRYVSAPDFDDGVDLQPNRLGFPDAQFREDLPDGGDPDDDVNTEVSAYGVASAFLRGPDIDWLPEHDVTLSVGWGSGLFREGEELDFYSFADSEGFFAGGSVHFELNESSVLRVMSEWNGFDLNAGVQFDFSGFRVGGHWLGANYQEDTGIYRSSKWGLLGSVALCLDGGAALCKPALLERPQPDTVRLPAPPPDTVVVEREVAPPLPTGTPTEICLATGENAQVYVTAQGDTLVGPRRISIRTLRPGVVFAGAYAEGMDWFENDETITFEEAEYAKSGGEVRLDCAEIMRVGEHMGVPLFAMRDAERPYDMLYVPVRPGVWQPYETGLEQTRGLE